jgi:hypothetical protein
MKALPRPLLLFTVTLALLIGGCVNRPPLKIEEPVGPAVYRPIQQEPGGKLVVYSAKASALSDPENEIHSSYKLRSESGALLKSISNRADSGGNHPDTILLPPGRYQVAARALNTGYVVVTVVIEDAKTTAVHLDGNNTERFATASVTDLVMLPDGSIIGYRAATHLP